MRLLKGVRFLLPTPVIFIQVVVLQKNTHGLFILPMFTIWHHRVSTRTEHTDHVDLAFKNPPRPHAKPRLKDQVDLLIFSCNIEILGEICLMRVLGIRLQVMEELNGKENVDIRLL